MTSAGLTVQVIWLVLGVGIMLFPQTISRYVVEDAWLVGLLFVAAALAWGQVLERTAVALGRDGLVGFLRSVFGSWIGCALAVLFSAWLVLLIAVVTRAMADFITALALPETPAFVAALFLIVPAAYAATQGLPAVAAACLMISPVMLLAVAVVLIAILPEARIERLLPVLGHGLLPVLRGGLVPLTFLTSSVWLLVRPLSPAVARPGRSIGIGLMIVGSVGMILEGLATAIFSDFRSLLYAPVFAAVRLVRPFLAHLDPAFIGILVFGALFQLAAIIWCCSALTADLLGGRGSKWLAWLIGGVAYTVSMVAFRSVPHLLRFVAGSFMWMGLVLHLTLPCIILSGHWLQAHHRQDHGRRK